jgi:hypothetical protein
MIPAFSHTGTPRHFTVSTTSGKACRMSARTRASAAPVVQMLDMRVDLLGGGGWFSSFRRADLLLHGQCLLLIGFSARWSALATLAISMNREGYYGAAGFLIWNKAEGEVFLFSDSP